MKQVRILCCVAMLLGIGSSVWAIDRDARMIDRASLDLAYLDETDSIGVSILGETALSTAWNEWAVLFGGGYGTVSPLNASNVDYWTVALGLKFYVAPVTSISVLGRIEEFMIPGPDRDAKSLTLSAKQRLLPADWSVSPFLQGGMTVRDRSTFTATGTDDSFSEFMVRAGGGCEFAMNEVLSFVFEGYYQLADTSNDDSEDLDGMLATVSMVYYWY